MIQTQPQEAYINEAEQFPANPDPYIYGWRYEARVDMEGVRRHVRVPLTLEDIRHPQEDDYRMHSYDHEKFCRYLANVFERQLAGQPQAAVLADVRVAWDKPSLKPNTPDISVVFDLKGHQNWTTFSEADEGTRPRLVVEITSPSTRHVDLVEKFGDYEEAEVDTYVIVDKYRRHGMWYYRLLGYRWTAQGYIDVPTNEAGWLWIEPVQAWLAWQDETLVGFNEAGEPLLDYAEIAQQVEAEMEARQAAEAQVQVEAAARQIAETQVQYEVEARQAAETQVQYEVEARQAAEVQAQTESAARQAAEAQAQAEAQARAELEARLRQMEAELRQLKNRSES